MGVVLGGCVLLAVSASAQVIKPGPVPIAPQPPAEPKPPSPATAPATADGKVYEVTQFEFIYAKGHPRLPDLKEIGAVKVDLVKADDGFVAPGPAEANAVTHTVDDLARQPLHAYHASALRHIDEAVVSFFNSRGLIGIFVMPDPRDIDPSSGLDKRKPGSRLRVLIFTGEVSRVRTIASGDRVPTEDRINNKAHEWIRWNSALQPSSDPNRPNDLLNKDQLDDYLFFLDRHPGRRVDAAVSSAGQPGQAVLDYLVAENKPWTAYLQASNTGTSRTGEWRERGGFVHNQLSGRDDILSLDYITSLQQTDALNASYEAPLFQWDRVRWKVFGSCDQFDAADVGQSGQDFKGKSWGFGADIIPNIYQHKQLFIDLIGGVRWQHIRVDNEAAALVGKDDFAFPHFGARLERMTDTASTLGSVNVETGIPTNSDQTELNRLGRLEPDTKWTVLQWDLSHSFYIEPLLARANPQSAQQGRFLTLAHEVAMAFKGQDALGNRLVPQAQQVVGGLYTVRGYPESFAAGDSTRVLTAEYRFHVPRVLPTRSDGGQTTWLGKPFRWLPQRPYDRPDWDLFFRPFFDVGQAVNTKRLYYEQDVTLMSTGIGFEFQFGRNFNLRMDWGVPLRSVRGEEDVQSGIQDSRVSVTATVSY